MSAYEEFKVLSADGSAGDHDPGLSDEGLLHCYRTMLMVRAFDDTAMKLQRSGRIGFSLVDKSWRYLGARIRRARPRRPWGLAAWATARP